MNVLVDTSVWSLALRRKSENLNATEIFIVAELSELVREGRARLIGLVRQELLSGIREPAQFQRLRQKLRAFPDEPLLTEDFEQAAELSNKCRSRGIIASTVDLLICATTLARGWQILTTDADFLSYARAIPIQLHRTSK